MNYTLEILVATIEEIKDELYAIYLRKQNKMSAELKLSVKLIQDIRLRFGMINTNQTNWTCADCIFTVLGHSIIPFIESGKYLELKGNYPNFQIEDLKGEEKTKLNIVSVLKLKTKI